MLILSSFLKIVVFNVKDVFGSVKILACLPVEDENIRLNNLCLQVLGAHIAELIIYWTEVMADDEMI
jgi:hypothetical protein